MYLLKFIFIFCCSISLGFAQTAQIVYNEYVPVENIFSPQEQFELINLVQSRNASLQVKEKIRVQTKIVSSLKMDLKQAIKYNVYDFYFYNLLYLADLMMFDGDYLSAENAINQAISENNKSFKIKYENYFFNKNLIAFQANLKRAWLSLLLNKEKEARKILEESLNSQWSLTTLDYIYYKQIEHFSDQIKKVNDLFCSDELQLLLWKLNVDRGTIIEAEDFNSSLLIPKEYYARLMDIVLTLNARYTYEAEKEWEIEQSNFNFKQFVMLADKTIKASIEIRNFEAAEALSEAYLGKLKTTFGSAKRLDPIKYNEELKKFERNLAWSMLLNNKELESKALFKKQIENGGFQMILNDYQVYVRQKEIQNKVLKISDIFDSTE